MKTKTLVLAAVMFLGLGAAAFAQATFDVGSIPVTAVVNTGLTELTGDITFTVRSGVSNSGTITISYGVPITVSSSSISITGISGASVNSLSNSSGILVINVPAGLTANQTFTVTGARVAVANTGLTSLTASISATNNAITAGETSVQVISSIAAGIASVSDKSSATGVVNAVSGSVTTQPVVRIKEGFIGAWVPPSGTNGSQGSGIRLTVSGVPSGNVTVSFPLTATTDAGASWQQVLCSNFTLAADSTTQVVISSSSGSPTTVCYRETAAGGTSDTTQETLIINPTVTGTSSGLPLAAASMTFTATMAPIGSALTSSGGVITTSPGNYIPRFVAAEVGPATLLSIVGNTTTLLLPFGQSIPSAGYDTGIAIANTTTDPGSSFTGFKSPTKQAGSITFFFFPQASGGTVPASFSYTTSASSPGSGLNTSGQVPSGSTYVVLLSQLLSAAGQSTTFSGYVFAVPGFTAAHGLFVISNFTTFSQGALMPVIQAPRDTFKFDVVNAPNAENVTF